MRRRVLCSIALLFALFAAPAHALERSLDGGAHIWAGSGWGEFRAFVGPRFRWGRFSLYPYGALGPAFFNGVSGSPLSLGAYGDASVEVGLADQKSWIFSAGGGAGHVVGLESMTGIFIPQAYGQVAYRWGINTVGLQVLWGRGYDRPDSFPTAFPERLNFTGIGLRFEYEIDNYGESD